MRERTNHYGSAETCKFGLDASVVESLKTDLSNMTAETVNFWLCKFVQEMRDQDVKRYPEKTVYQLICCIKRYYEKNGKAEMNPLNKENYKFQVFRKVLDAEMKVLHACTGEYRAKKVAKAERAAITVEEEKQLWRAGVLGESSAETLLKMLYFYIGKLFGLRAKEHRSLRLHNEKDHKDCVVKLFKKYISMVSELSRRNDAFYFRPSKTCYKFEDVPVGIHKLNSFLPSLTTEAGLERKTAHSLRVTCASTLFQNNVEEKLICERTGHRLNALFKYEKPSEEQTKCVSDCLGPPLVVESTDDGEKSNVEPEAAEENRFLDDDFDEYLASLNDDELALLHAKCECKDSNYSDPQTRNTSLDGLFCNSDISNASVNTVNLSK